MEFFLSDLHHHRRQLIRHVDRVFKLFIKDVKMLRHSLLLYVPNSATDYISEVMRPVYEDCIQVKGDLKGQKTPVRRGAHKMRLECLLEGVVGGMRRKSVFDDAFELMKRDWERSGSDLGSALRLRINRASGSAKESCETRFGEEKEKGSRESKKSSGGNAGVLEMAKDEHGKRARQLEEVTAMVKELKSVKEGWASK